MLQKTATKLNLGCGQKKLKGYVNVDNNPLALADVIHDLNVIPYPFKQNSFDEIVMEHVLEHLEHPLAVIQELYRIGRKNCFLVVKSPHFSCNWLHPGHRSAISTMLFDYFEHKGNDYYGHCTFKVLEVRMHWLRAPQEHGLVARACNALFNFFANLHVGFCQRVWCYWVGGFEEISFKARVIK